MCGFAGIVDFIAADIEKNKAILKDMGEALKLRGPDEENMYQDDLLSFVFRRLSIVDLKGGSQPIWNEDNHIFVSVNGEIYNHKELKSFLSGEYNFRTKSDSEVVLHLYQKYGTEVFSMLNGMFSVVIWDSIKNKLVLGRDRLGIKPLYYSINENQLLFGSELKSLLVHPDCPDTINWSDLNDLGIQQKKQVSSYVDGIFHFPAAHYATWSPDQALEFQPYWNIAKYFQNNRYETIDEIENKYEELINDSVQKRLMSDVPIGLFLSGGIDSSLIAALLAKHNTQVHCFTVVEESTYQAGDVENAKKVTESLGLPFYPVLFDLEEMSQNFNLTDFERMIALIESPRFDPEWYFKSELHRVAKNQVPDLKVMLLGQGADEFAGGYSKYLGSHWKNWDDYILHNVKPSLKEFEQQNKKIPNRLVNSIQDGIFFDSKISIYQSKMEALTYQLQYFNLWHEDRSSSYHGIESRVPFLDHRVVELLAGVPENLQAQLFWDKKLVRKTLKKMIPDYPENHDKVPFFVTDKKNTIRKFIIDIAKSIYQEFIKEYNEKNQFSLFDQDDMNELHKSLNKYDRECELNAWYLLEQMSITLFNAFIHDTQNYLNRCYYQHKQPLRVIDSNKWNETVYSLRNQSSHVNDEWGLHTLVNIPEQYRIMNPLTEEEGFAELVLSHKQKSELTIRIPDEQTWIVMLLDEMGRHADDPKNIAYWANRTNKSPGEIVNVLSGLVSGGFLERVN